MFKAFLMFSNVSMGHVGASTLSTGLIMVTLWFEGKEIITYQ